MARQVSALIPYYGSKRQMAKGIVEILGKHTSYLDPFCGSLAVEWAKQPSRMEIVNDLNGGLVNLIRVVKDDHLSEKLFARLLRTAFAEDLYLLSREECERYNGSKQPPYGDERWAYHYFVVSWMGRNGFVGSERELDSGFCKRFTSGGGDPATRFRSAVASIPWWWERTRNMTVLSEDGIGLIGRFEDAEGAVIYCDPPYLSKGAKYIHDFASKDEDPNAHPLVRQYGDHGRLALALSAKKNTRVVVSYYDDQALDVLYPGWNKQLVKVQKNIVKSNGGKSQDAPEVLLCNQEF